MADIFGDVTGGAVGQGLFPETMIHLGGDEVDTSCWTASPSIVAWMTDNGFDANDAYLYYFRRVTQIAIDMGREVVGWDEIWENFGTSLDPRTIVAGWRGWAFNATDVTSKGYRMLATPDTEWYLDSLSTTWQTRYAYEPCESGGTVAAENEALVLGGGGQMWGETADPSDVLPTIWPGMAAIAERLWSPREVTDVDAAAPRLAIFRCVLQSRGVPVTPITNDESRTSPIGPGSCLYQR